MIPFDTLKYARELESLGVPRDQAEGQTRALFDALQQFLAVRQRMAVPEGRAVAQRESEKPGMPVRLEALPGRRRTFIDWVLMLLMAVYVGMTVACVLGR
jgi:hypothetical protein